MGSILPVFSFTVCFTREVADGGPQGEDGGKGGKYLLLPPGYKGDVPRWLLVGLGVTACIGSSACSEHGRGVMVHPNLSMRIR